MHAAVILARFNEIFHVRGLRIFAEQRVIVGGAGFRHRAQPFAVNSCGQQPFTNQPVCFIGGLLQMILFHQRAKHVRERLV